MVRRVRVALLGDAMCDPRPRGLARYTRGLCTALLESGEIDLELVAHLSPAAGELPPAPVSRLTASRELVREHVAASPDVAAADRRPPRAGQSRAAGMGAVPDGGDP